MSKARLICHDFVFFIANVLVAIGGFMVLMTYGAHPEAVLGWTLGTASTSLIAFVALIWDLGSRSTPNPLDDDQEPIGYTKYARNPWGL